MARLLNKIENQFWDITIPLLTESAFVRYSFREAHAIYSNRSNLWAFLVLSGASLALAAGFILGRMHFLF